MEIDATREAQVAILDLVDEIRRLLDLEQEPDGCNVGFNAAAAAQSILHHTQVVAAPESHAARK